MKPKSIHFIPAVLVAAVILHAGALAGPGPQTEFLTQKIAIKKRVALSCIAELNGSRTATAVMKTCPRLTTVSGPHGDYYIFRR